MLLWRVEAELLKAKQPKGPPSSVVGRGVRLLQQLQLDFGAWCLCSHWLPSSCSLLCTWEETTFLLSQSPVRRSV